MTIKFKNRSYFGQGIIAAKKGMTIEDCPYGKDKEFARSQWLDGWKTLKQGHIGSAGKIGILKQELYEDLG